MKSIISVHKKTSVRYKMSRFSVKTFNSCVFLLDLAEIKEKRTHVYNHENNKNILKYEKNTL
jgi:hypothetical protein